MNDIEKLSRLADRADALLAIMPEIESLRDEVSRLRAERQKPLSTAEAAELLGVTPATVVNWVNRGMIPALMSRGGYRIPAHRIFAIAERQAAELFEPNFQHLNFLEGSSVLGLAALHGRIHRIIGRVAKKNVLCHFQSVS